MTVPAAPDAVWTVLADFGHLAEWARDVDHSCLTTEQAEGIGAARRVQVGPLTLVETVTEWEGGRSLAYTLDGLPPFVRRAVNRWVLEPAGPDHTTITLTLDMTPGPRPPMWPATMIATAVVRRATDRMLGGLTEAVRRADRLMATE